MRLPYLQLAALVLGWSVCAPLSVLGASNVLVTDVLDNGLEIAVKENHVAPVAAVRVYVKTGSMYEADYLGSGISHLFEHLINGGSTTTRSEAEIRALVDRLGGANNAYTTKDHTCYHITTTAEQAGDAIDLLADWMINSTFPENEFRREMGVVLEELHKGKEEPGRIIHKALYSTLFRHHPVRHPTIGYEEQVRRITRDDILAYYKRMYIPNNMVVVAVGDFDAYVIAERIRQAFQSFSRGVPPSPALPVEPRQISARKRTVYRSGLGGAYYRVVYRTIPLHHPDLYALDVLSYILSSGRSSRLVKTLQEEQHLVNSITSYSYTPAYDAGIFAVAGTCDDGNVEAALRAIEEALHAACDHGVSESEVEKAIKQKIAHDILGRQTAVDEAEELGMDILHTGQPNFSEAYLAGIRTVTTADVQRVARAYFTPENQTIALLRPTPASTAETTTAAKEEPLQARRFSLPNGLRLVVKRNPNVPLVNVRLLFLGGVRLEPTAHAGVSRILGEMLTRGTTTRSRQEIAHAFDLMGGRLAGASGNNTVGLEAEILSQDFASALVIIADAIHHPQFSESELETVKAHTLAAIARRHDSWSGEINDVFRREFFTQHPYQRDVLGETDTVQALRVADVRAYYQQCVRPQNGVMTVFGDVDVDAVVEQVTDAFAHFPASSAVTADVTPEPPLTASRTIEKQVDKQLAAVQFGFSGVSLLNQNDHYPMIVLDAVLSGIGYPGGRLHTHLRGQDRDLVYVVHGFNFVGLEPGYFGITAASSPAKMDEVIRVILSDIERIRTEEVDGDELEKAKIICVTMEQLSRQTNSATALHAAVNELYGLGFDDDRHYVERINAVTAADVLRVARKYLQHHVMVRTRPKVVAAPALN